MNSQVEQVTQADREAAWPFAGFHCLPDSQMRQRWFSGYYDTLPTGGAIRAFAAHRLASLASQPPVLDEREGSAAALERAIAKYMQAAGVPLTEFDPSFVTKMVSAMMVSFHKYGRVADAYPLKFNAADDVRARMAKYRQTGNKHFLADAANFAMIEAMHPAPERYAVWGDNDAANSPGRTTASGHRLVQEDNSGNRIMGETILHHPSNLGGPDDVA